MNKFEEAFSRALSAQAPSTESLKLNQGLVQYMKSASVARMAVDSIVGSPRGELQPYRDMQALIRTAYRKTGILEPNIGTHPDFKHLEGSPDIEYNHVATLFMDIESSTRLNLLYEPEEVVLIKNAFLSCAIAVVRAFDGHVHRIMGDATMAFFGGKGTTPEDDVLNALNCASVLMYFAENVVRKQLETIYGYTDPFGIRIGVDYGPKDEVAWAFYGYPGSSEITATSFYVDVASKLQHSAPRNKVMVGQSLREFVDLPDPLVSVKSAIKDGERVDEPYLLPNITKADGTAINYRKFIFDWKEFLKSTPMVQFDALGIGGVSNITVIQASVHSQKFGPQLFELSPSARVLNKDLWIKFKVVLPPNFGTYPINLRYTIQNHGLDAKSHGDTIRVSVEHVESYHDIGTKLEKWESTQYRGLHYTIAELQTKQIESIGRFGVAIK